jgi:serine/threonine protein kinase
VSSPDDLSGALGQGPADTDQIAMERARARAEQALFGRAAPARLGRYELGAPIAGGGMGMVYGGFDPELQRKVALKVLLPVRSQDARSQQRLVLEARALAKLDHPNVVKVHDVIDHAGQIVIVMELVEGETLARWEQAAPRTWRELVDAYAQAGEGLAAAHGVDVIHRDFKPSNAIMGADGRVRVLDFGLARLAADGAPIAPVVLAPRPTTGDVTGAPAVVAPRPTTGDIGTRGPRAPAGPPALTTTGDIGTPGARAPAGPPALTTTGDVVGTVAYASPEQLAGEPVTAASDQFSFCTALHRALEGRPPFAGADAASRLASIRADAPARSEKALPPWLRQAIARGLAPAPADRHPSMAALIAELRRVRGWRRWRWPALAIGLAALSAGGTALATGAAPEPCDGGAADVAAVWNAGQRVRIGAVIGRLPGPYAAQVSGRAVATVDAYQRDWTAAHRAACLAHRRGATSAALYDRQVACLTQRLRDLRSAIAVVAATDASSLDNAMDVVASVPGTASCDRDRVLAEVAPPDTLALQLQVASVRSQLSVGEAAARAGRIELALDRLGDAARQARATPYPPLQVEAALAEGRVLLASDQRDRARAALRPAREAALATGMLGAAVEAAARLIYIDGTERVDLPALEHELAYVLPLSDGLQKTSAARLLLLNNLGVVYQAASRRDDAYRYFAQARTELGPGDPADLELTCIDRNLAMLTADGPTREALAERTWRHLEATLGEAHPAALDALVAYGQYISDPARAFDRFTAAAAGYRRFHPTMTRQIAEVELKRALVAADLGRPDAPDIYAAVLAATAGATDPDLARWHRIAEGERAVLTGDADTAVRALAPVHAELAASTQWWERGFAFRAALGLGEAELARARSAAARPYLEAAARGLATIVPINEDVEARRLRARAQRLLAPLVRPSDPNRAAGLDQDARAFYRSANPTAYARWLRD